MIAVDTNILVYAHRSDTVWHDRALYWITTLSEGDTPWALPVFCLGEFLRVVTHRSIFTAPSTSQQALDALDALLQSPTVRVLHPSSVYFSLLRAAVAQGHVAGNLVFDAQIAALCREHGVNRLLTEDNDFARFPTLSIVGIDEDPTHI